MFYVYLSPPALPFENCETANTHFSATATTIPISQTAKHGILDEIS